MSSLYDPDMSPVPPNVSLEDKEGATDEKPSRNLLAQTIGSLTVIGYLALVLWQGPKVMLDMAWRAEMAEYEDRRTIDGITTDLVDKMGKNIDRLSSFTNLTHHELRLIVDQYSLAALPNASMLAVAGKTFNPRWTEVNARGALFENVMMTDNELVKFPSNESVYFSTIVFIFGLVAAAMICAAMVAVYHRILMKILFHVTGMSRAGGVESHEYLIMGRAREFLMIPVTIVYALFCLAQVCVFGWLESDKVWSFGDSVMWGTLSFTGIGHSPIKPAYMMGHPQMSLWLSLCNFCMYMHTSASIGLVILSALRAFAARDALDVLPPSDEQVNCIMKMDHMRVQGSSTGRPLYHN